MPHVIIKLHPGRSRDEKTAMAEAVAKSLNEVARYEVPYVSVSFEEVERSNWMADVYQKDLVDRQESLIKVPEYGPLASH